MKPLSFEQPLLDLQDKINQLKQLSEKGDMDLSVEIKKIEKRANYLKTQIYSNLNPMQIVEIARHPNRPDSLSLYKLIFDDFVELHGDRSFRDDPSIVGGLAQLKSHRIVVIGHQKGHDTKENIYRNFGMPHPEGYRKALRLMRLADNFNIPIITFIDTPGAYPGIEAEERGQAEAIARNLTEITGLSVPIISVVIGEGGSGGALGIGVSNKLYLLENSFYSVISPEGCASILFRDTSKSNLASEKLKLTASDIMELKIATNIIKEPLGGAHHDWQATATAILTTLLKELDLYVKISPDDIRQERYDKYRRMGKWTE